MNERSSRRVCCTAHSYGGDVLGVGRHAFITHQVAKIGDPFLEEIAPLYLKLETVHSQTSEYGVKSM